MNWNLKNYGDSFESQNYKLINAIFPTYEVIWRKYIGHIKGKPAPIKPDNEEFDKKRKSIGQWNYTVVKNHIIINELLEETVDIKITKDNLLDFEKRFILSTHLFYNIIECVNKINTTIKAPQITKYDGFKEFRNEIAHNLRPLIKLENKNYNVPKDFDLFLNLNKEWIWESDCYKDLEFQPLYSYLTFLLEQSKDIGNRTFKKTKKKLEENYKGKYSIIDPAENLSVEGNYIISGSTVQTYSSDYLL